ncbi:NHLP bacteriocin system secretion protein [Calothrix sp. NIES-2098]|uniref:NHLP bacteriocin system secretion protein n=1 Tax=Calothrix sp. NIES-2098 TaxID=1954171 RepID=UPI000B6216D0|nr:HlyD family secretion protein [Calothrix sp. NIES-2098]
MVTQRNNLFRKQALERSSSPERLDQIMQVVSPMSWLPLAALGTLVAAGLAWSVLGRIPITVEGRGVLVYPSKVVPLQFPAVEGKLKNVNVRVGDFVKQGQVIATIDQDDLHKQLLQQQAKLAELEAQDLNANSLQGQRSDLELKAIAQQRSGLQQRLSESQSLSPIIRDKDLGAIAQQRTNLQERWQEAKALAPTLRDRLERRKALKAEGAISADQVLEAQQTYLDSIAKIANIESQLKQLDINQVQAEKSYRENLSQITDIQTQLKQLDAKEKTLSEQNFQNTINRTNQIQDLKRGIAELQRKLTGSSEIKSDRTGRILELTITSGQLLPPGSRIGAIEAQESSAKLLGVTFLPVSEGKKVQKGMKLQITPTTVKRERFGGIVGTITNVSPFPVTKEAAASLVGNPDLVGSLVSSEPQIQVLAELQPDASTFSGYQWSSSTGPQMKMSPGTTTSVRITVEEQAPITFVLPILKSWSGIY